MLVKFMVIWNILWQFDIFCGLLVYFMALWFMYFLALWNIFWQFGIFMAIWNIYGNLEYLWQFGIFMAICYVYGLLVYVFCGSLEYFSSFGTFYQEKSGSPGPLPKFDIFDERLGLINFVSLNAFHEPVC
jgi:hypothetical protein